VSAVRVPIRLQGWCLLGVMSVLSHTPNYGAAAIMSALRCIQEGIGSKQIVNLVVYSLTNLTGPTVSASLARMDRCVIPLSGPSVIN